ncbi:hypothetical protein IFR04_015831, partial [Cadophora malorum]
MKTSMQPILGHMETQGPADSNSTPATPGWSISSDDERMKEHSTLNEMQGRYEGIVKVANSNSTKA